MGKERRPRASESDQELLADKHLIIYYFSQLQKSSSIISADYKHFIIYRWWFPFCIQVSDKWFYLLPIWKLGTLKMRLNSNSRKTGPLVPLSIGPLVDWSIGPLVHWSIVRLVHCSIGPLVKLLSERTSGVPPIIFWIVRCNWQCPMGTYLFDPHILLPDIAPT